MPTYLERLGDRTARVHTVLCVGIDPDPSAVPASLGTGLAGVERLARLLVEAAVPYAAAVKPNLAFFEAFGSAGIASLERIRALVPLMGRLCRHEPSPINHEPFSLEGP